MAAHVTLWHVPLSHFSEKVRWALDVKGVPHERRSLLGGTHPVVTAVLTRGRHQTVPVLTIGGRAIGDSTAILAELERLHPDPPLLPADADERRRALDLEELFDEEVGPYTRRWAYHHLLADPEARAAVTRKQVPWARGPLAGVAERTVTLFLDARFGVRSEAAAAKAEAKVLGGLDRLEAELDGRAHLCGDALSVADIAAASLLYPVVLPPEGPWAPSALPDAVRERLEEVRSRPAGRWVLETYARHRHPRGAAVQAAS